jgi:hypothetical protein
VIDGYPGSHEGPGSAVDYGAARAEQPGAFRAALLDWLAAT